jgi:methionyl-tRNA formyltransferase
MRVVFLGSASLAAVSLKALVARYRQSGNWKDVDVVGVVTQPDRPKGRHLKVASCPAKATAEEIAIPTLTPESVNAPDSVQAIHRLAPDLIVVVAYGQILKPAVLGIPSLGCINVHASLLPRYRGAAPIQWAIARGEPTTGVTTMYVNERMDAGDLIFRTEVPIDAEDTAGTLHDKLAQDGGDLLVKTLEAIRRGDAPRNPQDESMATYAPKLKKEDGRIDWTMPAGAIHNRIRGFNPWPGCFCERAAKAKPGASGERVKILASRVEPGTGTPGTVIGVSRHAPLVATGQGAVGLVEVQPEGRRPMTGEEYVRGHALKVGDILR